MSMTENVWERFDSIVDASEVVEAKAKFTPIEAGDYVATLEKLEPSVSQNGNPMLKGQFRTDSNKVVFYNQMLQNVNNPEMTAINVAEAVTFLSGITCKDLDFSTIGTLGKLAELASNVELYGRYNIRITYGTKDLEMKFPKIKVVSKVLSDTSFNNVEDDSLPFN